MDLINIIPISGAVGVFIAIVAMLAFLSGIGILIRKVNKRSWAYYSIQFVMFTGVMLLFDQMIGMNDLSISVIA